MSTAFILAFLCFLPRTALSGPLALSVPPDSFIDTHVDSLPQLSQQITVDPAVRRRLARHFHVSGPAVVHYIQNNLMLSRLLEPHRFQVYCIARNGHEYTTSSRLAAGTPVFVLCSTGQPILKLACGNPLVSALPPANVQVHKTTTAHSPVLASLPQAASATTPPVLKPNTVASIPISALPTSPSSLAHPNIGVLPLVKISDFPIQALAPATHVGASSLAYLAGIPLLYGIVHSGGSNGNTVPAGSNSSTGTGTGTGTGSPLVPESTGLSNFCGALLAVGMACLFSRIRKKMQRNTAR